MTLRGSACSMCCDVSALFLPQLILQEARINAIIIHLLIWFYPVRRLWSATAPGGSGRVAALLKELNLGYHTSGLPQRARIPSMYITKPAEIRPPRSFETSLWACQEKNSAGISPSPSRRGERHQIAVFYRYKCISCCISE